MTIDDKPRFQQAFSRLAVAMRETPDVATMWIYFEALEDLPIGAVEAAGLELARSGGTFFPTSAIWYEASRVALKRLHEARLSPRLGLPPAETAELIAAREQFLAKFAELCEKLPMAVASSGARGRRR